MNGDGLPDILIVFTALMNASVIGKHCSFFPFLLMCQYGPLYVCLTHRKSPCHSKSTALLFSEAGVLCLWLVMLKIFITSLCSYTFWSASSVCPYLILRQLHLFVLHLCTLHFVFRNTLTSLPFSPGHSIYLPGSKSLLIHK